MQDIKPLEGFSNPDFSASTSDVVAARQAIMNAFNDAVPVFAGQGVMKNLAAKFQAGPLSAEIEFKGVLFQLGCMILKGAFEGNYMRECASGGQSLANSERRVGMSGFAGKTDTEFFITNVLLCIIIGNPSPNILVVRTFECNAPFECLDYVRSVEVEEKKHTKSRTHNW